MKNIIISILTIGQFFFLVGCQNDLATTPPDFMSEEEFYANSANYEPGLNGVYDATQSNSYYGRMIVLLDGLSDNGICDATAVSDFGYFAKGTITSYVSNQIANVFQNAYVVIQRANTLLTYMDKNGQGSLSDSDYANIIAQARALRALAYQRLAYLYGDVPFYTGIMSTELATSIERTSRDEVIEFVLTELKEASEDLELAPMSDVMGRFTKQAALAFYAQTMVYEARLGNVKWSDALSAVNSAKTTADAASAGLFYVADGTNGLANYNGVFSLDNTCNKEMLFYVCYTAVDSSANMENNFSVTTGNKYICVHKNLAADYYTLDGKPYTGTNYSDTNSELDPRLQATVITPGSQYSNEGVWDTFTGMTTSMYTDFGARKFTTLRGSKDAALNEDGLLNLPVFRYAELLLLVAEAENQANNGPTAAAYDAIDAVRSRVGMAGVAAGLSKEQFNDEVIHERRVELALEGKRWFDLVTLGVAEEKINAIDECNRKFVVGKSELLPIPQTEIDRNPNLSQNAGY